MKLISILLGIITLPYADASNTPFVVEEVRQNEGTGNRCKVQVSINCVYIDNNGIEQPCLSKDDKVPFLYVRQDKCDEDLDANITLSMCNLNTDPNFIIKPDLSKTYFRFGSADIQGVADLFEDLGPGDCREVKRQVTINTCTKNNPMSVKLQGNMPGLDGNSFCYGYVHRKNRIRLIPKPQQGPNEVFQECAEVSKETGHVCNSRVAIKCAYNEEGEEKSCISTNDIEPFHAVRADLCQNNPINATITMTMCNENQNTTITPDQLPETSTYFRYRGEDFEVPDVREDILPGTCRTIIRQETIDTCIKKWPMSIQLEGNMINSAEGSSYCYCYVYRRSTINVFPPPPLPSPIDPNKEIATTESANPSATYSPSKSPSASPTTTHTPSKSLSAGPTTTQPPSKSPSAVPTTTQPPSKSPSASPSKVSKPIIITEITDPKTNDADPNDVPRFVELYVPDISMHSGTVDNLKLVVIDASGDLDWDNAIDLKDKPISSIGFITLCNQAGRLKYGQNCTAEVSNLISGAPTNIDGCYTLAVVHGDTNRYEVFDMYGVPGEPCEDTIHDFTDGQAVRLDNSTSPNSIWDQYNWEVSTPKDEVNIAPPGSWNPEISPCKPGEIIITELASPVDQASSRYVELYLPSCIGQRLKSGVKLVHWEEGSETPSASSISLQNVVVPEDGFIMICESSQAELTFGMYCDIIGGDNVPTGKGAIAVIDGDLGAEMNVVDSYGFPGARNGEHLLQSDFTNGRAVRRKPEEATKLWSPDQWIVYPGDDGKIQVGPKGMDPRVWLNPIIITEIMDPVLDISSPNEQPRFIELYVPDNSLHGQTIEDDLKIVIFSEGSFEPDWEKGFDLKGKHVQLDGLITICNAAGKVFYDNKCDLESSSIIPSPVENDGCYNVAIVAGDNDKYSIVDVFGVVGTRCKGTISDFSDGRALRLVNATYAEPEWNQYHWRIIHGANKKMGDPHIWTDDIPPSNCNLIITELASPSNNDLARYVELQSDNCAGMTIGDNLKLIRYDGGDSSNPLPGQVRLEGLTIGDDGFLLLCSTEASNLAYDGKCDVIVGQNTAVDNEGDESVAIVLEKANGDLETVDIFGRPDRDGSGTDQDFTQGRAVRDTSAKDPSDAWNPKDWDVMPGKGSTTVDISGMDPREWNDTPLKIFITELADPEDTTLKSFIELYSPNKAGKDVKEELLLVKFDENGDPPISFQCLKGLQFNDEGFIVFCRDKLEWDTTECQYQRDIAELGGTEDVAIVRGSCSDAPDYTTIVDIFGVPGEEVEGKQVFTLGRAVRKTDADEAKSSFDANDWIILPGPNGILVGSEDCDPGKWITEDQVVEAPSDVAGDGPNPTSPSQTPPTIAPATGKAGKGGKGAPKTRIRLLRKRL